MTEIDPRPRCRGCGAPLSRLFVDLGQQPPANRFLGRAELELPEPRFPLKVYLCDGCLLAQIPAANRPADIFNAGYAYFSSYTPSWVAHAGRYVETIVERLRLGRESFVLEVASNDGYLLQHVAARGIPCLGVDPAAAAAAAAKAKGVETRIGFFGAELARAIRARLLSGTALQSDETGMRVGKKNWWLWVFHHKDSAAFPIKPSRGKAVVAQFLGEHRPDFWVSDRFGAQMGWAAKENQVCLAHLIRDAQYAIDAGDRTLAPDLRHLLVRARAVGRRRDRLADTTLRAPAARLEARLDTLMRRVPADPVGRKFRHAIKTVRRHLFVFVTNRDIPPTNNGSERALRPCVVFRKITNGFRTEWGASLYADIRSVIETARRRAINTLDAIRLTLAGAPLPQPQ